MATTGITPLPSIPEVDEPLRTPPLLKKRASYISFLVTNTSSSSPEINPAPTGMTHFRFSRGLDFRTPHDHAHGLGASAPVTARQSPELGFQLNGEQSVAEETKLRAFVTDEHAPPGSCGIGTRLHSDTSSTGDGMGDENARPDTENSLTNGADTSNGNSTRNGVNPYTPGTLLPFRTPSAPPNPTSQRAAQTNPLSYNRPSNMADLLLAPSPENLLPISSPQNRNTSLNTNSMSANININTSNSNNAITHMNNLRRVQPCPIHDADCPGEGTTGLYEQIRRELGVRENYPAIMVGGREGRDGRSIIDWVALLREEVSRRRQLERFGGYEGFGGYGASGGAGVSFGEGHHEEEGGGYSGYGGYGGYRGQQGGYGGGPNSGGGQGGYGGHQSGYGGLNYDGGYGGQGGRYGGQQEHQGCYGGHQDPSVDMADIRVAMAMDLE
ncbi:hypothetical protein GQ43DRAFT_433030 [Delitschia confertaspora ATCC 74209]|uniref:Uncharacterized protein n=1 Tax=Delitschia confertaspora ATCC 74209 TaxID=1513339 RepID=A0A9P4MQY7_9PLEO|nr:hypothetical protein GQ43DRAFT_433030 [Delitschia confertaspora ATCC 74209]